MDPKATLQAIIEAAKEQDQEQVFEHCENLFRWIDMGGFAPVLPKNTFVSAGNGNQSYAIMWNKAGGVMIRHTTYGFSCSLVNFAEAES